MFKIKFQKMLQEQEKARFEQLAVFLKKTSHPSVEAIRGEVVKILGGQYDYAKSGRRLWIYRKRNDNALAVICETKVRREIFCRLRSQTK